jgi:hypothetical protein
MVGESRNDDLKNPWGHHFMIGFWKPLLDQMSELLSWFLFSSLNFSSSTALVNGDGLGTFGSNFVYNLLEKEMLLHAQPKPISFGRKCHS